MSFLYKMDKNKEVDFNTLIIWKKNHKIFFTFFIFLILISCSSRKDISSEKYFLVQKDSLSTIIESAKIESINATEITAPSNWDLTYQITFIPDEGTRVHKGDTVVVFDTRQVESKLNGFLKQLDILKQQIIQTRLRNQESIREHESQIKKLEIQKKIADSRLKQSYFNSDNDQKDARLEVKKTDLNLKSAKESLKAQKILNKNSENDILLNIKQTELNVSQAKNMLSDMFLIAPKDGMVVYQKQHRRGEKIKIGDSIRPRRGVLKIPDPDNMMAVIDLNEVDYQNVTQGMNAKLSIEAFPDTVFTGNVIYKSNVVNFDFEESFTKTYTIHVRINSKENFRLKPGLSAKVEIITNKYARAFRIPSWCLFQNDGQFHIKTTEQKQIPITLCKLFDGSAIIEGNISENLKIISNKQIPTF